MTILIAAATLVAGLGLLARASRRGRTLTTAEMALAGLATAAVALTLNGGGLMTDGRWAAVWPAMVVLELAGVRRG